MVSCHIATLGLANPVKLLNPATGAINEAKQGPKCEQDVGASSQQVVGGFDHFRW
ncbi:hypothetical protein D4764_01G0019810 [Takifugu flavidus]|uniref:Uncharacterized protein n=1 Tax=Takifugu flavidus TaxID=433684 RepID=A0A5C6PT43_9TELE|nr:hypothetical protein D4764_01G0019810 [Takifugu flavidus]